MADSRRERIAAGIFRISSPETDFLRDFSSYFQVDSKHILAFHVGEKVLDSKNVFVSDSVVRKYSGFVWYSCVWRPEFSVKFASIQTRDFLDIESLILYGNASVYRKKALDFMMGQLINRVDTPEVDWRPNESIPEDFYA